MRLFLFVGMGIVGLISLVAFDPLFILTLTIGGLLAGAAIYLGTLTLNIIRDWLRQNRPLYKEALAFAIKQGITNGNIRVVTGFFDIEEEKIKGSQVYEVEQLDEDLKRILPKNERIVIFT